MALETGTTNDFDVIEGLLKNVQDSIEGYAEASDIVDSAQLGEFFRTRSASRQTIANRLAERLKTINPTAEISRKGSIAGDLHHGFMKLRAAVQDNEEAALAEVERGESFLVERFQNALEKDISVETRNLLQQLLQTVESERADAARLNQFA